MTDKAEQPSAKPRAPLPKTIRSDLDNDLASRWADLMSPFTNDQIRDLVSNPPQMDGTAGMLLDGFRECAIAIVPLREILRLLDDSDAYHRA